jgi:hypothetical protein
MKTSNIKLEAFNDCPKAAEVQDYLYQHHLHPYIQVVDLDDIYHTNSGDTLVLEIFRGTSEVRIALALGQMAVKFFADELTWKVIEGTYIVRLWWD